jgi:hypothetical protein
VFGADLDVLAKGVENIGSRGWMDKFNEALNTMDTGAEASRKRVHELDAAFAEMTTNGNPDGAAAAFDRVTEKLLAQGRSIEEIRAAFPEYLAAKDAAKAKSDALSVAYEAEQQVLASLGAEIGETTLKTEEQTEAQKLLQKVFDDVSSSIMGFTDPMDAYRTGLDANKAKAEEWAEAQNEALDKTKVNWEDYPGRIKDSTGRSAEELAANKDKAQEWADAQKEAVDGAKVTWEDYAALGGAEQAGHRFQQLGRQPRQDRRSWSRRPRHRTRQDGPRGGAHSAGLRGRAGGPLQRGCRRSDPQRPPGPGRKRPGDRPGLADTERVRQPGRQRHR